MRVPMWLCIALCLIAHRTDNMLYHMKPMNFLSMCTTYIPYTQQHTQQKPTENFWQRRKKIFFSNTWLTVTSRLFKEYYTLNGDQFRSIFFPFFLCFLGFSSHSQCVFAMERIIKIEFTFGVLLACDCEFLISLLSLSLPLYTILAACQFLQSKI